MGASSTSELIRPARLDDAAACAAVYAPHVTNGTATFETVPPDAPEMARRMEKNAVRGWPWFVVERDGRIVGYAYACQFRDRAAYEHTGETSIYLSESATGQGLGGRLMDALLEACRAAGFRQMIAVIGDSGNLPSIRVHRAAGFRHVGTLENVGLKFGQWLDVVMMQKEL